MPAHEQRGCDSLGPTPRRPTIGPPVGPADEELLRAAAAGEAAAWNQLVERFAGLIWAISRACGLRDADAADVSQVVWLRLVENLDRLREPERLKSWLAVVARNEAARVSRRTGREVATDVTDVDREASNPPLEGRLVSAEDARAVRAALDELSPRCQTLLRVLAADPRPSYEAVSAMLAMPIGSIGPTRQRCLECLRRELARRHVSAAG